MLLTCNTKIILLYFYLVVYLFCIYAKYITYLVFCFYFTLPGGLIFTFSLFHFQPKTTFFLTWS